MYTPKHFADIDQEEILRFIRQYSFGLIVSVQDQLPLATHLPFVLSREEDRVILTSHFAKANKQWQQIDGQTVLVVFSEPHAYISPRHYDVALSVPTWNYIAVHAYGQIRLVTDEDRVMGLLDEMVGNYESEYAVRWKDMPLDFKENMAKGIVAFEIPVDRFSATNKLSQNKKPEERQRIIETLEHHDDGTARAVAEAMKVKYGNHPGLDNQ